jgi:hypothetical protein
MLALGLVGCVIYVDEWPRVGRDDVDTGWWRDSGAWSPPWPDEPPAVGDDRLFDRQLSSDIEGSALSIEWGTTENDSDVHGDWDLLFGNDTEERVDWFTVNLVTDDQSFVVDLGPITSPDQIPATVDPAEHAVGAFGEADDVPVIEGHVYLVRTVDANTTQYGLVQVVRHVPDDHVDVHWCRSTEPDRFVAPPGCCD